MSSTKPEGIGQVEAHGRLLEVPSSETYPSTTNSSTVTHQLQQSSSTPMVWSIFWITLLAFPLWWMLPEGQFGEGLQLTQSKQAQTLVVDYSLWQSRLTLSQWSLEQGNWYALFTHMLIHGGYPQPIPEGLMTGLIHLLCNMLTFLSLGRSVERTIGAKTFLALYLLSGLSGALLQVLTINPNLDKPMVGASGAVFGVVMVYCLLFVRHKLLLFFFFVAKARKVGWVVFWLTLALSALSFGSQFQQLSEFLRVEEWPSWLEFVVNSIAHRAHLGGALVGLAWGMAIAPSKAMQQKTLSNQSLPPDLLHNRASQLNPEAEELLLRVARSKPLSQTQREQLNTLSQNSIQRISKNRKDLNEISELGNS